MLSIFLLALAGVCLAFLLAVDPGLAGFLWAEAALRFYCLVYVRSEFGTRRIMVTVFPVQMVARLFAQPCLLMSRCLGLWAAGETGSGGCSSAISNGIRALSCMGNSTCAGTWDSQGPSFSH